MSEVQKPTIVFVHGAWCDASIWTKTLMPLAHEGYKVRAAQLSFESFAGDIAAVTRLLNQCEGPVLLVGHSYGGAVVTAAGVHPSVKALAYVTALVPKSGELINTVSSLFPAEEQITLTPDAEGFLWLTADFAARALGHDLHRGIINLAVAIQKPVNVAVFAESIAEPAWTTKPSAYLITTDDKILSPKTQHALAERIGARVEEVTSSHLVLLSQPEAVTDFVRRSAQSLSQ